MPNEEEEDSRLCPECRQTIERFSETGWVSDEHSDHCSRHPDNEAAVQRNA